MRCRAVSPILRIPPASYTPLRAPNGHVLSLLEQAHPLDELKAGCELSVAEIAQQLLGSKAWASLRLGVLAELSPRVLKALLMETTTASRSF